VEVSVGTRAFRWLRSLHSAPNHDLIVWFTHCLGAFGMLSGDMRIPAPAFPALALGLGLTLGLLAAPLRAENAQELEQLREAVRAGLALPLETILADALRRVPGKVVEVEVDLEDDEYEIEILAADGIVWELEYRASSGELLEIEHDD
jgi:hypothetical protein